MKKSGIILLTLCYFIVATGFAINIHYCGGKLKEISLTQSDECCCGSKKKAKRCCEEKTIVCKIKDNQKTAPKTIIPNISSKEITAACTLLNFLIFAPAETFQTELKRSHPPDRHSDAVFLLNRNFRI
jgi:hypothetical protein